MIFKNQELEKTGYLLLDFPMPIEIYPFVQKRQWRELDHYILKLSEVDGALFLFLSEIVNFHSLEHIIAIRSAPDDEDGIWHDDGSRILGFSLSLNLAPEKISGGDLLFKRKGDHSVVRFSPLEFGKIVIFLSGVYGYEHMVSAVTANERIVIAGWCS